MASNIALHEAGIPFELHKVDKRTRRVDGVDFTSINPKGYVPALQLDDGEVLTENVAVLQYIADLKPEAGLAPPAGTIERYRLMEWLSYINSEVHKSFTPLFSAETSDDTKTYARNNLRKRLTYLESALGDRQFLVGDHFTVADSYLFTVLSWSPHVSVDLSEWPHLHAYVERIRSRPKVVEVMTAEGLLRRK